jgi:hypothetical protein
MMRAGDEPQLRSGAFKVYGLETETWQDFCL